MADDEVVLTSFVLDGETLVDTWSVTGVGLGASRVPPATVGGEVLALSDRRLMWFDEELAAVDLGDVEAVDRTDFSHTSAPTIVRLGWAIFGLSLIVTAGLLVFAPLDFAVAVLPAMTGFTTLLVAVVVARARGETGTEVDLQRVVVETTEGDPATIWGESIDDLADAIEGEALGSRATGGIDGDEDVDGDEALAGDTTVDSGASDDERSTARADAGAAGERDADTEE